jgi:hypothetical protein
MQELKMVAVKYNAAVSTAVKSDLSGIGWYKNFINWKFTETDYISLFNLLAASCTNSESSKSHQYIEKDYL